MANISNREGKFWPDKTGIKNGTGEATSASYVTAYTAGANGGCVDVYYGYDLAGGESGGNGSIIRLKIGGNIIGGVLTVAVGGSETKTAALTLIQENLILTANQTVQLNVTHNSTVTGSAYIHVQGIDY